METRIIKASKSCVNRDGDHCTPASSAGKGGGRHFLNAFRTTRAKHDRVVILATRRSSTRGRFRFTHKKLSRRPIHLEWRITVLHSNAPKSIIFVRHFHTRKSSQDFWHRKSVFQPNRSIHRLETTATIPQATLVTMTKIPSNRARPANQFPVEMAGESAHSKSHGTRPPIAKARRSPRPNTAPIISGVGTAHITTDTKSSHAIKPPSRALAPSEIATTVTSTINHHRLNRNRGSVSLVECTEDRGGNSGAFIPSFSGMSRSAAAAKASGPIRPYYHVQHARPVAARDMPNQRSGNRLRGAISPRLA